MITDYHRPHYAGSSSFSQTLQNFPLQPLKTRATPFAGTTQSLTHTFGVPGVCVCFGHAEIEAFVCLPQASDERR